MKYLKLLSLALIFNIIIACDKDQDDISLSSAEANQLREIMLQGEWQITSYRLDEEDRTANFSDYSFVFGANNELMARSAVDNFSGTWRVSNDAGSETDSYYDVDFNIFFGAGEKLSELTRNYDVISASESEVKLSLENSSTGSVFLNFSRN